MKIRVGLVGLGEAWESNHRPALRALADRFEVRAVCEEIGIRAAQAASQFGATAVDGCRAPAARDDVDAILMLAPQWYGGLPILAACDAEKAVYCAAALDIPPEEALRIRQRVDESGVAFMAEFPRRFAPATLRLKELIATSLGRPRLVFCHQRLSVDKRAVKRTLLPSQTPVARALLEVVDWCRYVIGGEPSNVAGVRHANENRPGDEDYLMMSLDFSAPGEEGSGPVAQISCGDYIPAAWQEAIAFRPPAAMQVCCENGVAFIDLPASLVCFDDAGRHMESLESERPVSEQSLLQFHREVTSLVRHTSSLDDAYRALTIVAAAGESFQQGRRVSLTG